jgi:hypothetical protein
LIGMLPANRVKLASHNDCARLIDPCNRAAFAAL